MCRFALISDSKYLHFMLKLLLKSLFRSFTFGQLFAERNQPTKPTHFKASNMFFTLSKKIKPYLMLLAETTLNLN